MPGRLLILLYLIEASGSVAGEVPSCYDLSAREGLSISPVPGKTFHIYLQSGGNGSAVANFFLIGAGGDQTACTCSITL
jgi:hypothetical protein